MPTTSRPATAGEHIIEWHRPAETIPLQEQIDNGGQLVYAESRPGSWAEVRCSCGFAASGPVQEVRVGLERPRRAVAP